MACKRCAWELLLAGSPGAWAAPLTVPDPGSFVVDGAKLIDPAHEQQLELWLRELEQKTTAQVKVLTVPETPEEDVFSFAQRHAELWRLGQKGEDNGALIVVVPKSDRQSGAVRVQTGYGLEGALPDSWIGTLARDIVKRHLRAGRYSEGIYEFTAAVAHTVAQAANTELTGMIDTPRPANPQGGAICAGLMPLVILILIASSMGRRRGKNRRTWGGVDPWSTIILGQMLGRSLGGGRRWSGGGSGGFGRGLGGGFGGSFGGGGRFGGGGGGASW